MMKKTFVFVVLVVFVALLAACSGGGGAAPTQPAGEAQPASPNPPPEYAGKTNPLANDAAAIDAGQQLFAANCASCHGTLGKGDGPAAASLNPRPKDLADEMDRVSDAYLFWRISEGGMMAPFHSVMPAWKSILSEEQIWQIVAYLRTLKP